MNLGKNYIYFFFAASRGLSYDTAHPSILRRRKKSMFWVQETAFLIAVVNFILFCGPHQTSAPALRVAFFDKSNMYILSNTDNAAYILTFEAQRNKSMEQVFLGENEKLVLACVMIKILSLHPFCTLKKTYYEQKK